MMGLQAADDEHKKFIAHERTKNVELHQELQKVDNQMQAQSKAAEEVLTLPATSLTCSHLPVFQSTVCAWAP